MLAEDTLSEYFALLGTGLYCVLVVLTHPTGRRTYEGDIPEHRSLSEGAWLLVVLHIASHSWQYLEICSNLIHNLISQGSHTSYLSSES